MPDIVIIGNSGAARECYWLLQEMFEHSSPLREQWHFKGFLCWQGYPSNLKTLQGYNLGDAETYAITPDDYFVIGIGDVTLRKHIYEHFKARGAVFFTLRHPDTDVHPTAQMGEANILQRGCTIFCDCVVGNANYFNGGTNLSHDVVMGDYNFIGPFSIILGQSVVGSCNTFAVHSVVLPKARMGDSNSIAPASILYKGCKNNCRMAGNPALNIGCMQESERGA